MCLGFISILFYISLYTCPCMNIECSNSNSSRFVDIYNFYNEFSLQQFCDEIYCCKADCSSENSTRHINDVIKMGYHDWWKTMINKKCLLTRKLSDIEGAKPSLICPMALIDYKLS